MAVKLSPVYLDAQFIDGIPAVGAKLFTYAAGSTSKQATYTDSTGTVANSNPIILNARGEPPAIWLASGQTYKFVLASPTDSDPPTSPIRVIDNISGVNDTSINIDEWVASGLTPTYLSSTQFTIAGDQTSEFQVNRRVKILVSSGTVYGYIADSTFTTLTTVTVTLDAGALDAGLSQISLSLLRSSNPSVPALIDSLFRIVKSSALNVWARFSASNLTAPRVYTFPDKAGTLALTSDVFGYYGQCKLTKSGSNLLLSPVNGNLITINGQTQTIPSSGVTLAPPATTLTLYYIYAYMSGSTMTLEASITAYATDTSTGMTVKSGDSTRTLVGMARTVSNAWVDSSAQRFVRSWFNDDGIVSFNYLPSGVSNNTSGMIELNSSARAEFLSWLGETVNGFFNGYITSSGSGNAFTSIGVDGTTATDALSAGTVGSASAAMPAICNLVTNSLTEGYHYMTMLGQNQAATMTWAGSASVGSRCSISVRAKK